MEDKETHMAPPPSSIMDLETPNSEKETVVATSDEESAPPSSPPTEEQEQEQEQEQRTIVGLRWFLVCFALYIGTFIYGLDTTIAADVQGTVVEVFGHVEQLAWIGAGFPLGSVVVILFWGTLYTTYNMKWTFVVSMVLFEAGSALCGAAPTMTALIVGRVVAGAGGAGIFMGTLQYFTALTLPKERGLYISGTGFCWGIGAVLGPVVGGAFVQSSATWRWAFYVNLVLGAVFAPAYLLSLPSYHHVVGKSIFERTKTIDFLGLLLGAGTWVTFTMAFTMAGGQWPWNDGRSITTFVVFGLLLIVYLLQQSFCIFTTLETRSLPLHLFRSRTQVLLFIATMSCISGPFVLTYFIPIYFQFVHGDTAIDAAIRLLPFVIINVSSNLVAGHFLSKLKYYMPIYIVSGVIVSLGSALLTAYLKPTTPTSYIYGFTIIIAVGCGFSLQIGYAIATLTVGPKDTGGALGLQNIAQVGGQAVWLVIAGQVFQSTATKNLTKVLADTSFSAADIQAAIAGAQSVIFEQITGDLRAQAILAITKAMQRTFILVCSGGGGLIVSGLFMKREKLFGEIVTGGA